MEQIHYNGDHAISRIGIKAPNFYYSQPKLWFTQMESQFTLAAISDIKTKFHHVWSVLPEDIAILIPEAISKSQSYDTLKTFIIQNREKSKPAAIEEAMAELYLNDLKPSAYFRKLQILMEDAGLTDEKSPSYPESFL